MPFSAEQQLQLLALEYTIQRGLATAVDVRHAFCEIRDARLYRQDFNTFCDYCRKRWGMDPDQQGLLWR
jgi:hypothetical protein